MLYCLFAAVQGCVTVSSDAAAFVVYSEGGAASPDDSSSDDSHPAPQTSGRSVSNAASAQGPGAKAAPQAKKLKPSAVYRKKKKHEGTPRLLRFHGCVVGLILSISISFNSTCANLSSSFAAWVSDTCKHFLRSKDCASSSTVRCAGSHQQAQLSAYRLSARTQSLAWRCTDQLFCIVTFTI